MVSLRNMRLTDLPQVNLLLSKAFTYTLQNEGKFNERVPPCRPEFLEMYLDANPQGCFVIADKGKILAYCFSRLWGKVGWIGPLSVLPSEQGKGYGKQIVAAAVGYLKEQKASTIGLEMSADSANNLGFYVKLGFVPQETTVDLIKRNVNEQNKNLQLNVRLVKYSDCSVEEKRQFIKRATVFNRQIYEGLDYSREIELIHKHSFGNTFLIEKGRKTFAFLVTHSETYSQEERKFFLKVNALQLDGQLNKRAFEIVSNVIEFCANSENLPGIYIRFCTRYHQALPYFLENGYRIAKNDLRLTLTNYHQRDNLNSLNLSKWE